MKSPNLQSNIKRWQKFILKIITVDKDKPVNIYSFLLEFYIGRTFSLICDKVAKTIDMKEIEVGENKKA